VNLTIGQCRRRLTHRNTVLLWAWMMFGLVLAGMPRWEAHHHALADHDHTHAVAPDDHDAVSLHALDADEHGDDVAVTHLHALAPLPLAIHDVDLLATVVVVTERPVFAAEVAAAVAHRWPPPHRPPIA
jgi:hypothetical protein